MKYEKLKRWLGMDWGVQILWHPVGGYYSAIYEGWQHPSLCGASKRREQSVMDVTRWHLRFPVWFAINFRDKKCYPVATWTFIRVHRGWTPSQDYKSWKVWEFGKGSS